MKRLKKPSAKLTLRKKKSFRLVFLLLFGALGAVWLFKSVQQPSQGTISESSTILEPAAATVTSLTQYKGEYISFDYPESYRKEKGDNLPSSILESYRLIAPGKPRQPSWTIAITVYSLPSGNLADNSSYKIRVDNPKDYLRSTSEKNSQQIISFKKSDGSETAVFIQGGSKLLTLGFSGAVTNPAAKEDFEKIIKSSRWL